jgi:predicted Zn-dependent protease
MPPSFSDPAFRVRRAVRGLGLLLLLAWLPACGAISVQQERQLGSQVARQARQELPFVRDRLVVGYVRGIGEDIVQAAGPQPFDYHFYVVDDPDINAFAAPAGYIYVHTGTILAARDVSELAGVIAHEVGHVARRHIAKNYNRQRNTGILYQLGVLAASMFGGGYAGQAASVGGSLAAQAYLNDFSREDERDADAFAVGVLPRAGYDPNGLVTFFGTIRRQSGAGGGFLSSHPATTERIRNTQGMIRKLELDESLRRDDRGKLELIQRRIRLLTGAVGPEPAPLPAPEPSGPTPL